MTSLLPLGGWYASFSCGTLFGSVTERTAIGEATGGGDMCVFLLSPSRSMGNGALSEP
jgi:hypothetical protein